MFHTCLTCDKSFPTASRLATHSRKIHVAIDKRLVSGDAFKCSECNLSFRSKATMVAHARIHDANEKPFECSRCNARFNSSAGLKRHQVSHNPNAEKPFSCRFCNASFARATTKKVHERTHTGERSFPCQICNRSFTTSSQLNRHSATHNPEKPFMCTICDRPISRKDHLRTHLKKQHNITDLEDLKRLQNLGKRSSTTRKKSASAAPKVSTISSPSSLSSAPLAATLSVSSFSDSDTYMSDSSSGYRIGKKFRRDIMDSLSSAASSVSSMDDMSTSPDSYDVMDFPLEITDEECSQSSSDEELARGVQPILPNDECHSGFSKSAFTPSTFSDTHRATSMSASPSLSEAAEAASQRKALATPAPSPMVDELRNSPIYQLLASAEADGYKLPEPEQMPQFSTAFRHLLSLFPSSDPEPPSTVASLSSSDILDTLTTTANLNDFPLPSNDFDNFMNTTDISFLENMNNHDNNNSCNSTTTCKFDNIGLNRITNTDLDYAMYSKAAALDLPVSSASAIDLLA